VSQHSGVRRADRTDELVGVSGVDVRPRVEEPALSTLPLMDCFITTTNAGLECGSLGVREVASAWLERRTPRQKAEDEQQRRTGESCGDVRRKASNFQLETRHDFETRTVEGRQ